MTTTQNIPSSGAGNDGRLLKFPDLSAIGVPGNSRSEMDRGPTSSTHSGHAKRALAGNPQRSGWPEHLNLHRATETMRRREHFGGKNAFSALLTRHPHVETRLRQVLNDFGTQPVNQRFVHDLMLKMLHDAGVGRSEYPFNTMSLGREALRHWVNRARDLPIQPASQLLRASKRRTTASEAPAALIRGNARVRVECPNLPYEAWTLDESLGNLEIVVRIRSGQPSGARND